MKNYKIEKFKSKEEWLSNRSIGGSSASAVFNLNPWLSREDLYVSLVKKIKQEYSGTDDSDSNESTQYGHDAEPLIRNLFRLDFPQYEVIDPIDGEMYRRNDKQFMTATIDGTLINKETKEKLILEIKTHDIRSKEDEENWSGQLPIYYLIQCCHYLAVLNDYSGAILVAKLRWRNFTDQTIRKQEIRYYYIYRSDEEVAKLINQIETAEQKFYADVEQHNHPSFIVKF